MACLIHHLWVLLVVSNLRHIPVHLVAILREVVVRIYRFLGDGVLYLLDDRQISGLVGGADLFN